MMTLNDCGQVGGIHNKQDLSSYRPLGNAECHAVPFLPHRSTANILLLVGQVRLEPTPVSRNFF
jgi:hypothetical protein